MRALLAHVAAGVVASLALCPPTAGATTSDGGTQQVCIKAVTGRKLYDSGFIDISIDQGKGAGYQRESPKSLQTVGTTVVEKCYSQIKGVRVQGPSVDDWVGSITFSTDGGSTYTAGSCATCNTNPSGSTGQIMTELDDNHNKVGSPTHAHL